MNIINILELELRVQQSLVLNHVSCAESNNVKLTKFQEFFLVSSYMETKKLSRYHHSLHLLIEDAGETYRAKIGEARKQKVVLISQDRRRLKITL